jgi:hypothetical protein
MTNKKETLEAQLTHLENAFEEQALSSQTIEEELAKCQERIQHATEQNTALEVCPYTCEC